MSRDTEQEPWVNRPDDPSRQGPDARRSGGHRLPFLDHASVKSESLSQRLAMLTLPRPADSVGDGERKSNVPQLIGLDPISTKLKGEL